MLSAGQVCSQPRLGANSGNILAGSRSWPDWYLASQQYLVDPRQAKEDKSRPHNRPLRTGSHPAQLLTKGLKDSPVFGRMFNLDRNKICSPNGFPYQRTQGPKDHSAEKVFFIKALDFYTTQEKNFCPPVTVVQIKSTSS